MTSCPQVIQSLRDSTLARDFSAPVQVLDRNVRRHLESAMNHHERTGLLKNQATPLTTTVRGTFWSPCLTMSSTHSKYATGKPGLLLATSAIEAIGFAQCRASVPLPDLHRKLFPGLRMAPSTPLLTQQTAVQALGLS